MIINQYTLMGALVSEAGSVRDQLAQAQQQSTTGYVSTTYAGLGTQARTALDLSPQIAHQTAWSSNIDAANSRLSVTQTALTSIQSVASSFYAKVNSVDPSDQNSLNNIAVEARSALTEVASLLNTKSGDAYVFAGTDTGNAPVTSTDPTTLTTDLLASDTPSSPPFSATIGTSAPKVETGEGVWTSVGLVANKNSYAPATQPTTGSSMRDVLRSLASLTTLTSANASSVTADVRSRLSSAISGISTEAGGLGAVQNVIKQRQSDLSTLGDTLKAQLSSAQEVDPAAAISKVQTLTTQLQASYKIISGAQNLSLANYL